MGAFLKTMNLAAQRHGLIADFTPVFSRNGTDLYVGSVRFRGWLTLAALPICSPGLPRTGTPTASRMTGRRCQTSCGPR